MDYKGETKRAYNLYPEKFDEKFEKSFREFIKPQADTFIAHLRGKKIVDLGSGPGHHAKYFQEKELDVLCIDVSKEMVRLCREKGLKAEVGDMEDLNLPEKEFDGVWAYASLLHIPKKNVPKVIKQIAQVLKPGGLLGLAVKAGEGEGFEEREEYPDTQRWFTYFLDNEVREIINKYFEVLSSGRDQTFLHYILRLK